VDFTSLGLFVPTSQAPEVGNANVLCLRLSIFWLGGGTSAVPVRWRVPARTFFFFLSASHYRSRDLFLSLLLTTLRFHPESLRPYVRSPPATSSLPPFDARPQFPLVLKEFFLNDHFFLWLETLPSSGLPPSSSAAGSILIFLYSHLPP